MAPVKVSAKSDYAVRALLELAQAGDGPVKGERLAQTQGIPLKFLENILIDLRHAGIVRSQRGAEGGYWLARGADSISVGEALRPPCAARRPRTSTTTAPRSISRRSGSPSGRASGASSTS